MRHSSFRIVAGVSCLLFGAAAWELAPHSSSEFTAQAQTAKPAVVSSQSAAQLKSVSDVGSAKLSIPDPRPTLPPGTEIYTAKRGEAIPTIARHYLGKTSYLTSSELADAIRSANHKSDAQQHPQSEREHRYPRHPLRPDYRKDDRRSQGF